MNSSPGRGTFHSQCRFKDIIDEGLDPNTDEDYLEAVKRENFVIDAVKKREATKSWKQHNLEYDLRSTKWICDKAKAREEYAQNLYAAMCNNEFQKNDVWLLLKDQRYSCSWRYAGGIIADMREEGDYIDWYCSGIKGSISNEELANLTPADQARYHWVTENFVGESTVTNEIREDLFKLGWNVIDNDTTI